MNPTHASLIARATWAPYKSVSRPGCDARHPDTALIAFLPDVTLLIDGAEIVILDTEGREHTFTLSEPVTIG